MCGETMLDKYLVLSWARLRLFCVFILTFAAYSHGQVIDRGVLKYVVNFKPSDCTVTAGYGDNVEFHYVSKAMDGTGDHIALYFGSYIIMTQKSPLIGKISSSFWKSLAVIDEGTRHVGRPFSIRLSETENDSVPFSIGAARVTPLASLGPGLEGMCLGERPVL